MDSSLPASIGNSVKNSNVIAWGPRYKPQRYSQFWDPPQVRLLSLHFRAWGLTTNLDLIAGLDK